jgi:hypothetical protein
MYEEASMPGRLHVAGRHPAAPMPMRQDAERPNEPERRVETLGPA